MDIETREKPKQLGTPEHWAERRKHIRPPRKYVVIYVAVNILAIAALWMYAVGAGIRGGAALVGGVLVTLMQLMNVREDSIGESRVWVVSEVLFIICMIINANRHPSGPVLPLVVIFLALLVLDLGIWTWPFPWSLKDRSWIRP